jgi:hypothetical protein
MRKGWIIILALIIVGLTGYFLVNKTKDVQGSKTKAITSEQLLQKLEGIWIREEYISVLEKTKSPLMAIKELSEVQINFVKNDDKNFEFCIIYNYHEGVSREIEKLRPFKEGKFNIGLTGKYGSDQKEQYFLQVDSLENPSKMTFEYQRGKFNLIKIDERDEEDFVNKVVLSGKYRDQTGEIYVFEDNRIARWLNESFKYRVGLDFVFGNHNDIWLVDDKDKNLGIYYTYEWKDNRLFVYRASIPEGEAVVPEEEPFLILERL